MVGVTEVVGRIRLGLSVDYPSISPIACVARHMHPMITSQPNPRIGLLGFIQYIIVDFSLPARTG
jgi:hypothetical protein